MSKQKPPKLTPQEIVWAYCANELYSGYPCRTEGCPYCGGPDHADAVVEQVRQWINPSPKNPTRRRNHV